MSAVRRISAAQGCITPTPLDSAVSPTSVRWPQFHRAAQDVRIISVHSVPVRLGSNVLGTLGLLGNDACQFKHDDLALAQTLADLVTVALVNDRTAADLTAVDSQLQTAFTSRILVEQARGVIARGAALDTNAAFDCMCDYARLHRRRLSEVANEVVHHHVTLEAVLAHARTTVWVHESARVT